jgi:hypothetical protein
MSDQLELEIKQQAQKIAPDVVDVAGRDVLEAAERIAETHDKGLGDIHFRLWEETLNNVMMTHVLAVE